MLFRSPANRGELARATAVAAKVGRVLENVVAPPPGGVPPAATLHLKLALDFRRKARRIEAHEHFRTALQLAPDWREAAYNWALLHASDGAGFEALRWYRRAVAPGLGDAVPPRARQRLLALIAEVFFAGDRAVLATRTIELALREGGGAGVEPELEQQLRAQLARFGAVGVVR